MQATFKINCYTTFEKPLLNVQKTFKFYLGRERGRGREEEGEREGGGGRRRERGREGGERESP